MISRRLAGLKVGDSFESISNILAFMTGGRLIVDDYVIMLHNIYALHTVLLASKLCFKKLSTWTLWHLDELQGTIPRICECSDALKRDGIAVRWLPERQSKTMCSFQGVKSYSKDQSGHINAYKGVWMVKTWCVFLFGTLNAEDNWTIEKYTLAVSTLSPSN